MLGKRQRSDDIALFKFEEPDSQEQVYTQLVGLYESSIWWYLREKEGKSRRSKLIRLTSLILLVLGGAVPLTTPVWTALNSAWGYVLLALAAGLQLVDRYFGYSSAWSRYVSSAMRLNSGLLRLQVAWLSSDSNDTKLRWAALESFGAALADEISSETASWTAEFNEGVEDLRRDAKAKSEGEK